MEYLIGDLILCIIMAISLGATAYALKVNYVDSMRPPSLLHRFLHGVWKYLVRSKPIQDDSTHADILPTRKIEIGDCFKQCGRTSPYPSGKGDLICLNCGSSIKSMIND